MNNLKHTKGPWWCSSTHLEILKMPEQIKISNGISGESRQTAEANARLISCAPEMLEALIELDVFYREDKNSKIPIVSIRKLIEKATGMKIEEILR